MLSAADLKSLIDTELRSFVFAETDLLEAVDPLLAPVGARLRAAVADGKRIRAAFCYWGWRAAGQGDTPAMVRAAAAIELVHAAALVNDDLIDDSPLRRGVATPHVALRDATAKAPDPDAAARSLALLTGDLLMAWAGQLFTGWGLPALYLARARPMWSVLARELIAGECLEVQRTGTETDPQESLAIVRYKTAKYTVRASAAHRGPARRRLGSHPARLHRVRTPVGRSVPTTRRPAGRVRRPRGHRQIKPRRPHCGPADRPGRLRAAGC